MKHFIISLIALVSVLLPVSAQSQKQESFLFPDFVRGHLVFANGTSADAEVDFDTIRQTLYYIRGNDVMELTNLQDLRTLTIGDRTFVMHDGLLCEVYDLQGNKVLVNWKFRNVNKGSKGAMGATTQNRVDVLWTAGSHATADDRTGEHSLDIWSIRCEQEAEGPVQGFPGPGSGAQGLCQGEPPADDFRGGLLQALFRTVPPARRIKKQSTTDL